MTPFTDGWTWINGVPLTTQAVTYPDPTWPGSFWFSGWKFPTPFKGAQPNGGGIGEEGNCGGTYYLNGEWFDVPCDTADNDRFTCIICQQYVGLPSPAPLESASLMISKTCHDSFASDVAHSSLNYSRPTFPTKFRSSERQLRRASMWAITWRVLEACND